LLSFSTLPQPCCGAPFSHRNLFEKSQLPITFRFEHYAEYQIKLKSGEMKPLLFALVPLRFLAALRLRKCRASVKSMIQRKEYDRAIAELQRLTKENPNNMEAFYVLGNVYYEKAQNDKRAEDYRMATENYRKVLSMKSSEKQAAVFQLQAENTIRTMWAIVFNDGVSAFNESVQDKNPDTRKLRMDTAIAKFQLAIEIVPDSMQVYCPLRVATLWKGSMPKLNRFCVNTSKRTQTKSMPILSWTMLWKNKINLLKRLRFWKS
jgi:tetratricopeptide (TPR) repeat protein